MREIYLVFQGHTDSEQREQRAADIIQEAIFDALSHYGMDILQFQNQQRTEHAKVAIGSPESLNETLKVPDFMKKQST